MLLLQPELLKFSKLTGESRQRIITETAVSINMAPKMFAQTASVILSKNLRKEFRNESNFNIKEKDIADQTKKGGLNIGDPSQIKEPICSTRLLVSL